MPCRESVERPQHPAHAAVTGLSRIIASTDGQLAYTYYSQRSELHVIQGLK